MRARLAVLLRRALMALALILPTTLAASAATLKARSGRDINLAGLVKTAGAEVAIALLHHAEALASQKRR